MEEPPLRQEEEEEEEEGDEAGPEGALGKSPFQLTTEDVYDISYVMGRELMALGSDPRVTQLQFKIVRVLEMLETLVNEGNLTVEELRMERDNLRKEVEGLRTEGSAAGGQVNLGPDKMVVDLTDPNRPRFTLQELRDVLQERNKLKSQLLVVQEELQCYKSGLIPPREGPGGRRENDALVAKTSKTSSNKEEKTIIRKLHCSRSWGCSEQDRAPAFMVLPFQQGSQNEQVLFPIGEADVARKPRLRQRFLDSRRQCTKTSKLISQFFQTRPSLTGTPQCHAYSLYLLICFP
ncbi:RILP-like protein 2 isoform X2 [Zalophus californianus]|uniref:RILP-like protein 2 n=1 Tax=Zalophus californianus TaxID=9704 RepID=A0A6J2BJK8_ZALCA|nr:RILP-like protein 2 isoform X2 [Zalophus californianus]